MDEVTFEGDWEAFFAEVESCAAMLGFLGQQQTAHQWLAKLGSSSPGLEPREPRALQSIDQEMTSEG